MRIFEACICYIYKFILLLNFFLLKREKTFFFVFFLVLASLLADGLLSFCGI